MSRTVSQSSTLPGSDKSVRDTGKVTSQSPRKPAYRVPHTAEEIQEILDWEGDDAEYEDDGDDEGDGGMSQE